MTDSNPCIHTHTHKIKPCIINFFCFLFLELVAYLLLDRWVPQERHLFPWQVPGRLAPSKQPWFPLRRLEQRGGSYTICTLI